MKRLEQIRAAINEAADKANELVGSTKKKDREGVPLQLAEVRRLIVKAKSTSGVILDARCMSLALTKLDEARMWFRRDEVEMAQRRLQESVMWAEEGIREQKAA